MTPVFLDSNVFLYAAGAGHPLRTPCQSLLARIGDGALAATTSVEVVQEVMHVAARRGDRAQAAAMAEALLALFPGLLAVTPAVVLRACQLFRRHPNLSIRDALRAATMRGNGLDTIVTADRHFDRIDGLRRVAPACSGRLGTPARSARRPALPDRADGQLPALRAARRAARSGGRPSSTFWRGAARQRQTGSPGSEPQSNQNFTIIVKKCLTIINLVVSFCPWRSKSGST